MTIRPSANALIGFECGEIASQSSCGRFMLKKSSPAANPNESGTVASAAENGRANRLSRICTNPSTFRKPSARRPVDAKSRRWSSSGFATAMRLLTPTVSWRSGAAAVWAESRLAGPGDRRQRFLGFYDRLLASPGRGLLNRRTVEKFLPIKSGSYLAGDFGTFSNRRKIFNSRRFEFRCESSLEAIWRTIFDSSTVSFRDRKGRCMSFEIFSRQILIKDPFQILVTRSRIDVAIPTHLLVYFGLPNFVRFHLVMF